MLTLKGISASYGTTRALDSVSLTVDSGEIVAVLGPNGAGKTTLLHTISGLTSAASGHIDFGGKGLGQLTPVERVKMGIILCPEGRKLFGSLTVEENLRLGATRRRRTWKQLGDERDRLLELFPILGERMSQPAGTLSGGEQQMVALARSLIAAPEVLLLDEPTLGLAPKIAREVLSVLPKIAAQGIAILLVEQNLRAAVSIADHSLGLRNGRLFSRQATANSNELLDLLVGTT